MSLMYLLQRYYSAKSSVPLLIIALNYVLKSCTIVLPQIHNYVVMQKFSLDPAIRLVQLYNYTNHTIKYR